MNNHSTKTFSWKAAILLSVGVGLLSAGLSIFLQARSQTVASAPAQAVVVAATTATTTQAFLAEDPKPVATTTTTSTAPVAMGLGSSFDEPNKPVRLIIPAIGVDAAVQSVGLSWTGNGTMGVPTNFTDVGWYNQGPFPGMPGSAVIDGHLDGKYVKKAVFYDLGALKPGDLVEVIDQAGDTLSFRVVKLMDYGYNATTSDVFAGDTSKARLNLITCSGDWIKNQKLYDKRVVVFTELIQAGSQ